MPKKTNRTKKTETNFDNRFLDLKILNYFNKM